MLKDNNLNYYKFKTNIMKKNYSLPIFLILFQISLSGFTQSIQLVKRELSIAELPSNNLHIYSNALRTKYVQIDFAALNQVNEFELSLFNQKSLYFKFNKQFIYTIGAESWYGKEINGSGDVIFSFYQGNMNGIIVDDFNHKYILQQINKSDLFALTEVNNESMQESPVNQNDFVEDIPLPKKSRANADVCALATDCGTASTIDLMVLGAAAAIVNGGGTVASFTANVTSAVTEMNTAYSNSGGINLTFNLIHCDATSFTTTSNMSADLSNFSADAGVQSLRNTHHADLVGLWAGSGNYAGFCGLGYLNTNPTNYSDNAAFTITDYGCGMTNLSFAHECGHNMGLRHDYYVDGSTTPCSHHHGYVNQAVIPSGLPTTARWRTIMAYNNHCSDNGFNCTRLARWANPATNYLGSATGIAIGSTDPSNEIYGFERMRCVVAGFRANPLPVNLLSFNGIENNNSILLKWKTTNELNNKGFDIQLKRNDQLEYNTVGFVPAKETSELINNYEYSLYNLLPGQYTIRLKQLDIDNKSAYSKSILLDIASDKFQTQLFPNPIQHNGNITIFNPKAQQVTIMIYDCIGKQIMTICNENLNRGAFDFKMSSEQLPNGSYYCVVRAGNDKQVIAFNIK